ncbi:serine/threonine-protein phosphatase 6 regulatory ankyrin repeat subunit A-like [Mizuhopecten yessoensis]|uniref:Tankyrase-2 n=1 Tax=Mizuhopecten yessoensis TaxID=6573 RepID=A0A210PPS5_MIZYE|nr:serine/threonine-protein phosphatase 6 regulatory ankyrin repeat subunit A-like [Mizuhopecten yessoensis]OWF38454.1 Tankyrase-2 [Mizuhopecten yessoensis]
MTISLIDTIRNGDLKTAKTMLQNNNYPNIDAQTCRRDGTALYWACSLGFLDILQLLLLQGANTCTKTEWGATPLSAASDNNHTQIVRILLKLNADVNSKTSSGDTPCHLAAYRGFSAVVQLLVEGGADIRLRNNKGQTAYDLAKNSEHSKIASYLHAVSEMFENKERSNRQTALACTSTVNMRTVVKSEYPVQNYHVLHRSVDNYTPRSCVPYTPSTRTVACAKKGCSHSVCQFLKNDLNDLSTSCPTKRQLSFNNIVTLEQ